MNNGKNVYLPSKSFPAISKVWEIAAAIVAPTMDFYRDGNRVITDYHDRMTGRLVSIHDPRD